MPDRRGEAHKNMYIRKTLLAVCATFIFCAAPAVCRASSITYTAVDLVDTGGGDLWQYTFDTTNVGLTAGQGFQLLFDPALYSNLSVVSNPINWDVITIQPNGSPTPLDGIVDALMLANAGSIPQIFDVSFVWLASLGTPGSQPYVMYDYDANTGNISMTGASATQLAGAQVPEPGSLILLGSGLLTLAASRRKRRSQ